ncbi:MAG: DNA-binding CsgD family transcriptional regulator [Crocinitomicaceae bacterium]|jgi:DNA-binding CsgD family transcriptional regulator
MRGLLTSIFLAYLTFFSIGQEDRDRLLKSADFKASSLVNKSHAERTIILTPFYEWGLRYLDSNIIFNQLNKVERLAKKHRDRGLELEAKLMVAHYYLCRPKFSKKTVISKLEKLDKIAKEENVVWLEIRIQNILGNYHFFNLKEYEIGFEYYERTRYLLKNTTAKKFPLKAACLHQIGNAHFYFHDYTQALNLYKETLKAYRKRENDYVYVQSMNTIGLCYRELNNLESSSSYFNSLLNYSKNTKNRVWQSVSIGNLAANNVAEGNYSSASERIETALEIDEKESNWIIAIDHLLILGEIKLHLKEFEEAKKIEERINAYMILLKEPHPRKATLFPFLAKVAIYKSNPELASLYMDSAFTINDSLSKTFNGIKVSRAMQKVLLEQTNNEAKFEKLKQEKELWIRNGIIILLIIIVAIIFLIFRQNRLKAKNSELAIHLQRQATIIELEHLKSTVIEKNELVDSIKKELNQSNEKLLTSIADSNSNVNNEAHEIILEQLRNSSLLTDQSWREFVLLFEEVHIDYLNRLNKKWSNLTPSEMRLLVLSRLNLGNAEMASMLGVGTNAIRQVKSRLRKKLDLNQETDFYHIAKSV